MSPRIHHRDSLLDNFGHGIDRGTAGQFRSPLGSLLAYMMQSCSCGRLLGPAGNGVDESVGTGRWLLDAVVTVGLVFRILHCYVRLSVCCWLSFASVCLAAFSLNASLSHKCGCNAVTSVW